MTGQKRSVRDAVTVTAKDNADGTKTLPGWERTFLAYYREHGTLYKAAKAAGVTSVTAWRHIKADPEFADAVEHARQEYADALEEGMHELFTAKNNVVAGIVMLKGLRPEKYIERQQIQTMSVNVDVQIESSEARGFLRDLLLGATQATKQRLGVVSASPSDAEKTTALPLAELPEHAESAPETTQQDGGVA
jgi:hypothetical protein